MALGDVVEVWAAPADHLLLEASAARRMMKGGMCLGRHDTKVLDPIIGGVAIDMVDVFIRPKFSAKMLFH